MAFNIEKFTSISGQPVTKRSLCKWGYLTTDSVATIQATGYFSDIKNQLQEGHIIEVQIVDSSDNVLETMEFQVASKTATVLVVLPKREGEVLAVGVITDVSTSSNIDIAFAGGDVALKKVYTILGGAVTTADATITVDNSSAIELGQITVAYSGSAAGDIDSLALNGELDEVGTSFNIATDGGSTVARELVVVLVGSADTTAYGDTVAYQLKIADVSGANTSELIPASIAARIIDVYTTISGDPGADVILSAYINTTAITDGAVTIASGSAAGTIDSATPTALNATTSADYLKIVSNGGATNIVSAEITLILRK